MRKQLIDKIFTIAKQPNAFDLLEKYLETPSKQEISEQIIEVGIMPEFFDHDSSEEKLWAKYSDIMLAKSLEYLGFKAHVMRTRGNSADVFAQSDGYTLIGDAKCFRLSRSAKNQKDFKIKALDDWRRENTYAVLVGPLNQYTGNRGQIYEQAIDRNVTLISYTHLKFLLDNSVNDKLKRLWEVGMRLKNLLRTKAHHRGDAYWEEIDKTVLEVTGKNIKNLIEYKLLEVEITKKNGEEAITYWESKIKELSGLSREEAVKRLIKSQKIEQKIRTIQKAMNRSIPL